MAANSYALQHPKHGAVVKLRHATYRLTVIDNTTAFGSNALPAVLGRVTLLGNGATIERPAVAPKMRLLQIDKSGNLTIENARLTGGLSTSRGGGLLNFGSLTLQQSVVRGNAARAGGGIDNIHALTLDRTTVTGNHTPGNGGGILNHGRLQFDNSTLSGNSAGSGGAIATTGGAVDLTNATLAGDRVTRRGKELVVAAGSIQFVNTIVGSAVGQKNCLFSAAATHTDRGHNLDAGATCGFRKALHSLTGVSPRIKALGNYGGPTPTMQLKATSPAIGNASRTVCHASPINNVDQRGYRRTSQAHPSCDIGAFEHQG
jgi:hypothetical protein